MRYQFRYKATSSILDTIGNTPLVEIKSLNPNPNVRLFAKLESFNPGGSVKDRIALSMIEAAEEDGLLNKEKIVLEATSGNTGIGLALVCAVKGYQLLLTMPESVSIERQKILKALGAKLRLTPAHLGTDGAIEEAYRLARKYPETYFMTDQFNNEANWQAHFKGTALEIWEQTGGRITTFVATMGTGGTLMGVSRRLKELNPKIRIVGVEPYLGHKIQGLKNMKESYKPGIFDKTRLDEKVNVEDEESFEMTRRLAKEEGIFVGMSSGAAMVVAQNEAARMTEGVLVVIFPDGGERYLSTPLFTLREETNLRFYNALTRRKEAFVPVYPEKVSIYTCGPAVHDHISIEDLRRFISADLIRRYLEYKGYSVNHIVNMSDLDDKAIQGSEKAGMDLKSFTEKYIKAFKDDMTTLGIKAATMYPKASEHISDMVSLTAQLVKKGFAYEKLRSVYFDISRWPRYGRLSRVNLNKIRIGSTVDLDEYEKENPKDFTLLKRARLSELKRGIYTKTEWGNIRPTWHIECVALSTKYLGQPFDVHTSSRELMFPHHENELAISEALTGKPLARYWIHCERVVSSEKGSDLDPGATNLRELLQHGYKGREIRYFFLSRHYRKPLRFSLEGLNQAKRALRRLDNFVESLKSVKGGSPAYHELDQSIYDLKQRFADAMDDDLNISLVMAAIYNFIRQTNRYLSKGAIDRSGRDKILAALRKIDSVLNIFRFEEEPTDPEVEELIREREAARKRKDWKRADQIRELLLARGVEVRDKKV
nr:cysteine--tRNA ligase [Desulfobacterales bacterium]